MEGRSSADRRGGRYHVILCVVIGEMTLSTCLLCRLLTQDENQSHVFNYFFEQVNAAKNAKNASSRKLLIGSDALIPSNAMKIMD